MYMVSNDSKNFKNLQFFGGLGDMFNEDKNSESLVKTFAKYLVK